MEGSSAGFSFSGKLKNTFIGKAKDIQDKGIFHKLTLIAFTITPFLFIGAYFFFVKINGCRSHKGLFRKHIS